MAGWRIARSPDGACLEPVPGMRVQIQTIARRAVHTHTATIQDVFDSAVDIAVPAEALRDFWRVPGQAVVGYLNHAGKRYVFDTDVLEVADIPCPLVRVRPPDLLFPFDERSSYRLRKVIEPAAALLLDPAHPPPRPVSLTVLDLSAGGLQAVIQEPAAPGHLLQVDLPLPPFGIVRVHAQVLRVRAPELAGQPFRLHARFVNLTEADRQRIVRFVFEEQGKLRRRGLL